MLRTGDALDLLRQMPDESVQCCITSPPYYGLRDYGTAGQIGLEATPDEYVARLVEVFREVRRALRGDGTLWLNLGDSYAANRSYQVSNSINPAHDFGGANATVLPAGMKPKDLMGIPWMVAFALRTDGWYLRSEIIWSKPNPMPESVRDRPTKAHEQVFLLSKQPRYFYDADAIRENATVGNHPRTIFDNGPQQVPPGASPHTGLRFAAGPEAGRNKRSVWEIATAPYAEAHFATFPPKLVEPMILAGCPNGGTVLDPFAGSGTVGVVCGWHGRDFIGLELNPEYVALAERRIMVEGRPSRRPSDAPAVVDGQESLLDLLVAGSCVRSVKDDE